MATVTPPTAPTPGAGQPAAQPTVVVPEPPASLLRLALGARLEALVLSAGARGSVELQIPGGRIQVQANIPLAEGARVTLQVLARTPQLLLLVTSVDGRRAGLAGRSVAGAALGGGGTVAAGSPASLGPGGGVAGAVPGAAALPLGTLSPGATVTAILLRPLRATIGGAAPSPGGPSAGPPASLQPQAGRPAAGGGPAPAGTPGPSVPIPRPGTTAATQGPEPGSAGGPARGASVLLTQGTQLPVRVVNVQPAGTTAGLAGPTPAGGLSLAPGQTLTGAVTGTATSGHPIVYTRAGPLAVAVRGPVPQGTVVTLEVAGRAIPPEPLPALHGASARAGMWINRSWPSLNEALDLLQEIGPGVAQQLVTTVLPQANAQLTANVLFFLAALRGGDVGAWIGQRAARLIERTRPQLMGRLREDFTLLGRMADEPGPGEWRTTLVPFHNGAEIEQIRLLLRHHGGGEDDEADGEEQKGTRFIVDVELSRLGRIQLDGLLTDRNRHLDLIVRSQSRLLPAMRDDINRLFQEANQVTGLKGGLSFQASPGSFVEAPAGETGAHGPGLIV